MLAKNNPEFMSGFDPELNPGIDIDTLLSTDKVFIHYILNGVVRKRRVRELFRHPGHMWSLSERSRRHPPISECREFMVNFDASLNPDIDPAKLTCTSRKKVRYRLNGKVIESRIVHMFRRKNMWGPPNDNPNIKTERMIDNEEFMRGFDADLNPDVEPYMLTKSSRVSIRYIVNGHIVSSTVKDLCKMNVMWKPLKAFALRFSDLPEFMAGFSQELNPDFDPYTTPIGRLLKIRYLYNGQEYSATTRTLQTRKRMWDPHSPSKVLSDCPEIMQVFDQGLNPDIDPQTTSIVSGLLIKYYDGDELKTDTAKNYARRILANPDYFHERHPPLCESKEFMEGFNQKLNPHIDVTKVTQRSSQFVRYEYDGEIKENRIFELFKMKEMWRPQDAKHRNGHKELAISNEKFRKVFDPSINEDVILDKLSAGSRQRIKLKYRNKIISVRPEDIIRSPADEYIPKIKRLDENIDTIRDYWSDDNAIPFDLANISDNVIYLLQCPHCGNNFKAKANQILSNGFICPRCQDTGDYDKVIPDYMSSVRERYKHKNNN